MAVVSAGLRLVVMCCWIFGISSWKYARRVSMLSRWMELMMVDMVAIISECDVIGGEVGDVCVGEVGDVRRLRRVRGRRRCGGVVEGLGSGGTGSFFQTKVFGGG